MALHLFPRDQASSQPLVKPRRTSARSCSNSFGAGVSWWLVVLSPSELGLGLWTLDFNSIRLRLRNLVTAGAFDGTKLFRLIMGLSLLKLPLSVRENIYRQCHLICPCSTVGDITVGLPLIMPTSTEWSDVLSFIEWPCVRIEGPYKKRLSS